MKPLSLYTIIVYALLTTSCKKERLTASGNNELQLFKHNLNLAYGRGAGGSADGEIDVVEVSTNVIIDFNTPTPTCTGDINLLPYFTFEKNGSTPDTWNAIFALGQDKLLLKDGATITLLRVNGYSPGLVITANEVVTEQGSHVVASSLNKNSGNLSITAVGNIFIDGELKDETTGTLGIPGSITIKSTGGNIKVGRTGLVQALGVDPGGNTINLITCGENAQGDITIDGLVMSFAHAHAGDLTLNRPNIRVASFNGSIFINANTVEPLFDEFQANGTRYDLWGGLLSWARDNVNPGSVKVQAKKDIIVNGHGADPTGTVRKSFGAIAAISTASNAPGGLVDVRSLEGSITGNDRAFDVSGRNRMSVNFALLRLHAKQNILLYRPGANNTFNPQIDASSPTVGDKGGKTDLRSFSGEIIVGVNALVSASVPAGSGSVQGINQLSSCMGINNAGIINPADVLVSDDSGNCGDAMPAQLFTSCLNLDL